MLVVEGPDGAGKTTLIDMFRREHGLEVAPRVVSKDTEAMTDLREWVDRNLDEGLQMTIFDRYRLISEPIYGPVLRQVQQPGFSDIAWMGPRIERFYQLKPTIIYCLPPLEVVKANIADDEDNRVVREKIDGIYAAYVAKASMDYFHQRHMNVKIWDYTRSPKIQGLPIWFNAIVHQLQNRISES